MSDQTSQEPTMEEILASIRRIISEDDAPAEEPKAEAAEKVGSGAGSGSGSGSGSGAGAHLLGRARG